MDPQQGVAPGYRAVNAPSEGLPDNVGSQLKAMTESFNGLAKQYWDQYAVFPSMENEKFTDSYSHIWGFYEKCLAPFERRLKQLQYTMALTKMFHEVMDEIHNSFEAVKKGNRDRYTI